MRHLLLLLGLSATAFGAWWDGAKGDITLSTITLSEGQTVFNISCSNPAATAVRIKVTVYVPADNWVERDWRVYSVVSRTVDLEPQYYLGRFRSSFASISLPIRESMIFENPRITLLLDGDTVRF